MFSHVMVGVNNIEESRVFYDKIFKVLGADPGKMYPNYLDRKDTSIILKEQLFTEPIDGKPATVSKWHNYWVQYITQSKAMHGQGGD